MKESFTYQEISGLITDLTIKTEKFSSLSDKQLLTKPDPTSWCVGEIFEHIVMFNGIYLKMIQSALKFDQLPIYSTDQFAPRRTFGPIINFIKPPYRVKIKTIAPMSPLDIDSDNYHQQYGQILTP